MAIDNDMKIVLGASLDTSEKAVKSLARDIKTLKNSLKNEKLGLQVKLSNDAESVKTIKADIATLQQKLANSKIGLNYKLNLSNDNKTEINKQIDALNNMKSINALKLRVEIDTSKATIDKLNKQIDTLSKALNGITIKTNVDVGTLKESAKDKVEKVSNTGSNKGYGKDVLPTQSLDNQGKLLKETKKDMGEIVTKTKEYQTGLAEVEKITTVAVAGGKEQLHSIETINDYQKTSNDLYKRQAQIEKEITQWKNLKKNASQEELEKINQAIASLERERSDNDAILSTEQLQNAELDEKIRKQREMSQVLENQKEMLREMKIGEDTGFQDENLFGNPEAIEEWAKSVHGSGVSISNISTRIKTLNDQQNKFTVSTKSSKGMVTEYTYAVDKATGKVFKLGERTREAGRRLIDWQNDFKIAINRLLEWNMAMFLVQGSMKKFAEGINFIKELDNQLTQVAMVTGQTREEVQGLTQEYIDMAKATSKTVSEIARVNTELTRQGLGKTQSEERLETILKLSSVASMDVNNTLSVITSSVNALGQTAEHTADVLVRAGNISASSVESIGTAMTKVASSAKSAGTSIEQLTGMTATLIDVTQEAPETLGNSLKSMMARFSKINELGELNEDLNDVNKAFATVGIAFTDSEGQIRPFYDLLNDMASVWDTLDKNTKSYVATLSAGTMQGNRFLALMDNWERVSSITSDLETNASGVLDDSYQVWMESIEAQMNRLQIAWEELWTTIINSDEIILAFKAITAIVETLNFAFDKLGTGGVAVSVSMFAIMTKAGALNKVFNALKNSTTMLQASQGVYNALLSTTRTETKKLSLAMTLQDAINKKLGISSTIASVGIGRYAFEVIKATMATAGLGIATVAITGGLSLIIGLIGTLAGGLLTSAISNVLDLGSSSKKTASSIDELVSSSKEAIKTHEKSISSLNKVSDKFDEYQKRIESGKEALKLTATEQEEYNKILEQMADISPDIISGYDEQGNAVARYGTRVDDLIQKEKALLNLEKQKILASADDVTKSVKKETKKINKEQTKNKANFVDVLDRNEYMSIDDQFESTLKRMEYLRNKLTEGTISDRELDKLKELENNYRKYLANVQITNSELDKQKQRLQEIVNIELDDTFDNLDMEDSLKGMGKELVIDIFSTAFEKDVDTAQDKAQEAMITFSNIYQEMSDIIDDDAPTTLSDNVERDKEAINQLAQSLVDLGIPAEDATSWIYNIAHAMIEAKGECDSLVLSVSSLTEKFKEQYSEIDKLQGYFKKLAKSERLAMDEVADLIELYPELGEYIAQTGDVTLENGDKVREILQEKYQLLQNELSEQKELQDKTIKRLKSEQAELEKTLKLKEKVYGTEAKVVQEAREKLQAKNEELKNASAEYAKVVVHAKALGTVLEDNFNTEGLDALSAGFKEATDQIADYKAMLKELQENGISGTIIKEVMANHTELIDVLDDEGAMYERLIQLIAEQEETQKDSYRRMMNYSKTFFNSVLKGNVDLYNKLRDMYGDEVNNFKSMYDAKLRIINDFNAKYSSSLSSQLANMSVFELSAQKATAEKKYNELMANKPANAMGFLGLSSASQQLWQSQVDKVKAEIDTYNTLIQAQGASDKTTELKLDNIQMDSVNIGSSDKKDKKESKKKKSKIKLIELETDAYLKLKKAMEEVERQQSKNQKMLDYADGKDKIVLLTKEIDLLTKKQKITSNLANQYREELAKLEKELAKKIGLNDGANGINNYNAYMKAQEKTINGLINQINASTNDDVIETLTEKKDNLKEQVDKFKESFERYIDLKTSIIPDLSDDWWDMVYEKFEKTLEIMETDLAKYEKQIERINSSLGYILQGRNDNKKVLEKEYELMLNMSTIYQSEIDNIKDKIQANNAMVEKYEKQLASISDKQSDTYLATSNYLLLARHEQDKLAEALSSALDQYSNQLNTQISKHIEMLEEMKETAIETFTEMRKELDEFSTKEFEVELDTILNSLNKIDGIFMKNPEYTLSTSEARKDLSDLEDDVTDIYSKINGFKTLSDKITKATVKDEQSAIKQKEDMLALIEEQIEYENELKEIYTAIKEQLAETTLEYQKIEDALQNQIDVKKEELDNLKEQFETESKITSMMEKRLALLKAMDDTRYTYITGQGESVFTYDVSNVNALKQEIGKAQREEEKDEMLNAIQEEIDKMSENLDKTKEIHEQQLAILELQESKVSDLLDILSDNLDSNLGENLDKIYENLTDVYIENLQTALDTQTNILSELYKLIDSRTAISATNIKQTIDSNSNIATSTTTHKVGKNETLESIASAYNTDVSKLLKLNTGLKKDKPLQYGQSIKVPSAFDTGGYTGEFGSEGKLAILHEKELVLNKQDTSNVLQAVDIAKSIASGIGNIGTTSVEKVTNNNNSTTTEQQQIIQNMNIYGVQDANAFSNEMQKLFRHGMARLS